MEDATVVLLVGEDCCIECAAKREYNKMVLQIMTADDPPSSYDEIRLELVLEFLDTADFSKLRGSNEILDGTRGARCLLSRNRDGEPFVSVIDT